MLQSLEIFLVLCIVFILGNRMASQALITPVAKFKHDFSGNFSILERDKLGLDKIDEKIEAGDSGPPQGL